MENIILMKENPELLELSSQLGFSKTLFLDKDVVLVEGKNKKQVLKEIREGKKKGLMVIVRPETEEILRFVLERTEADMILGQELINPKDSVHFRRGGLDQITCKIAARRRKKIGFSFRDILGGRASGTTKVVLESKDRSNLLGRMMLNVKLCKKYKVELVLGNFSKSKMEMRGKQELKAFERILKF
ncbi:hypothetical protein GOV03_02810 [Candidatus Woesearchaeota archaeon]|nr:hypothetical protein [Candidatus Woesearchaeota archaeon]